MKKCTQNPSVIFCWSTNTPSSSSSWDDLNRLLWTSLPAVCFLALNTAVTQILMTRSVLPDEIIVLESCYWLPFVPAALRRQSCPEFEASTGYRDHASTTKSTPEMFTFSLLHLNRTRSTNFFYHIYFWQWNCKNHWVFVMYVHNHTVYIWTHTHNLEVHISITYQKKHCQLWEDRMNMVWHQDGWYIPFNILIIP